MPLFSQDNQTLYYYKDDQDNEVDFAILEQGKTTALYQVCFDLTDEETSNREIRSLTKAGTTLDCSNLYLITLEKPDQLTLPKAIKIITFSELL